MLNLNGAPAQNGAVGIYRTLSRAALNEFDSTSLLYRQYEMPLFQQMPPTVGHQVSLWSTVSVRSPIAKIIAVQFI